MNSSVFARKSFIVVLYLQTISLLISQIPKFIFPVNIGQNSESKNPNHMPAFQINYVGYN